MREDTDTLRAAPEEDTRNSGSTNSMSHGEECFSYTPFKDEGIEELEMLMNGEQ